MFLGAFMVALGKIIYSLIHIKYKIEGPISVVLNPIPIFYIFHKMIYIPRYSALIINVYVETGFPCLILFGLKGSPAMSLTRTRS